MNIVYFVERDQHQGAFNLSLTFDYCEWRPLWGVASSRHSLYLSCSCCCPIWIPWNGAGRKRFELWLETAKKAKSRAALVCNRHRKSQSQSQTEVDVEAKNETKQVKLKLEQSAIGLIVVIVIVVIVHCCCCFFVNGFLKFKCWVLTFKSSELCNGPSELNWTLITEFMYDPILLKVSFALQNHFGPIEKLTPKTRNDVEIVEMKRNAAIGCDQSLI